MVKKMALLLLIIIAITNLFTYVLANNIFTDVKADAWYAPYLTSLAERKIVEGYDDGTFGPTDELNYNQYLKMVVVTITGENLAPKEGEKWDTPYINKAYDLGLIPDKNQDYNTPINRYEMARVALEGLTILKEEAAVDYKKYETDIKDYENIPAEYKEVVLKAYSKGLITGYTDGTFGGEKTMRRSESVAVIARLIDKTLRVLPGEGKIPEEEKSERPKGETSIERLKSEKVYEVYEKVPEIMISTGKTFDTLYFREDNISGYLECDLDIYVGELTTSIQIYKNSPKTLEVTKKIIKIFYPERHEEVYKAVVDAYEKNTKYTKIVNNKSLDVRRGSKANIVVIRMYNFIYEDLHRVSGSR